jgi:hypothetical protein
MGRTDTRSIEDDLEDLERKLQRLRIEYDQYFSGNGRREPAQLRADVQKTITRYSSEPPRNTQLKFKFNSLVARFQALRALWGRTLREIEAGTYRGHKFRADLHDLERLEGAQAPERPRRPARSIDKLCDALDSARRKTGEGGSGIDRRRVEQVVRQQTQRLKQKNPNAKVRFKVVIEGNKAKLKATVA